MNHIKNISIILVCLSMFSLASEHRRFGSSFSYEIDFKGLGQESILTIMTEADKTKGQEMVVSFRSPQGKTPLRTVVTASQEGVYSVPVVFENKGQWGMWLRYGLGLENFERTQRFVIGDELEVLGGSSSFRGSLAPDVPNYVQPMGYAIFGTLLLCTLLMLTRLFYWLNKQHRTETL